MTPSVAVVGGGPAGLMAAEVLARAGARVTIYEMHRSPGRKLLLAGRSGLNITHTEPFVDLLARYEDPAPALVSALERFGPSRVRDWVEGLGHATFVGSSGRLFPVEHRAAPLLRSWLRRLAGLGVELETEHRWTGWAGPDWAGPDLCFESAAGDVLVAADATVLALGGASWPRVGGDGGWVAALEAEGVDVVALRPANCGVSIGWTGVFADRFEGEPVKNVVVSVGEQSVRGEMIVTRTGLEGGPVYAFASTLGRAGRFPCRVVLDLAPDLDESALARRLSKRRPKASQANWLRGAGLVPVAVGLLRECTGNRLPDDPGAMATLVKATAIEVVGLASLDRAISTAGGVSFDALDDQLMLRHRAGVYVAGEMLDWDAPTGGYLLQACLSTGYAAGAAAVDYLGLDGDIGRDPERETDRDPDPDPERETDRARDPERETDRDRDPERETDRARDPERETDRARDPERETDRDRDLDRQSDPH